MKKALKLLTASCFVILLVNTVFAGGGAVRRNGKKRKKITFKKRYLKYSGNYVVYQPNRDRRRASYTDYLIPKSNFKKFFSSLSQADGKTVILRINKTKRSIYRPSDPRSESPIGGFRMIKHYAEIIKLLSPALQNSSGKMLNLFMRPSDLSSSGNYVYYRPGRNRRSATYKTYIFKKANFNKYFQTFNAVRGYVLVVKVLKKEIKRHRPSDPRSQSPIGGFRIKQYYVKITRVRGGR